MCAPHANSIRKISRWRLRSRSLTLGTKTLVMGIVNVTPDSFSDGGVYFAPERAVDHALQLLDDGAEILDIGAESTRPGSHAGGVDATVSAAEEQRRLLPVLRGILKARPDAILSADTYRAETARVALDAGAEIINDVSGFQWDASMASVCAAAECGVVLMHTRGYPDAWAAQQQLEQEELMRGVYSGLQESLQIAKLAGISQDAVVLDPGYGFGKRGDGNFVLLAKQAELLALGRPLLVGLSRKSFLGMDVPAEKRETSSIAAMVTAVLQGASIVRAHAVKQAVDAVRIADAVLAEM